MVVKSNGEKPIHDAEVSKLTLKEKILGELEKESESVVTLAYMYAKGFALIGEDVTKAWQTSAIQTDMLSRAYTKGWDDSVKHMLESAKYQDYWDWIEKNMKKEDNNGG